MRVLVVAECNGDFVSSGTRSVVRCASRISSDVDVLVLGAVSDNAFRACAKMNGVCRVLKVRQDRQTSERIAQAVSQVADGYSHVLFSSSIAAKTVMPRVAALLNVPALSEIGEVVSPDTFKRYIYAGSLFATVRIEASPVVATVRQTAFEPVGEGEEVPCEEVDVQTDARGFERISLKNKEPDAVDLETAKIVVSAGRGVIDEAGFSAAQSLASKLHAAVGSTRALVDAFIAPNDTQVGQTGKIVAPDLYFAFGISGAIQHLAGMKDSKIIVAVNTDPEAPIIDVCDYWLQADAVETIKALEEKL